MTLAELGKNGKKKYYIREGAQIYQSKDDSIFTDTVKLLNGTDFFTFAIQTDLNSFADKICNECDEKTWNKYQGYEILTMFSKQTGKTDFKSIIILSCR